ncbi:hypothetical protein AVDCRST_MAG92-4407 [uncultured Coleofasciculus sp.]|uniref:Uncharacterized protein n=1 Tax=uncultured Coleofasciculus sp. TaxID=1267456 RepID=A0A6J4JZM5_9CYAN|nr:hypothetical protein AVDCRST_MAG92-4407 [uncultured Coleofasciculus sp.]
MVLEPVLCPDRGSADVVCHGCSRTLETSIQMLQSGVSTPHIHSQLHLSRLSARGETADYGNGTEWERHSGQGKSAENQPHYGD